MEYEHGKEYELNLGEEDLELGKVFRTHGKAPGQTDIYWEPLENLGGGKYNCKVVGINMYVKTVF